MALQLGLKRPLVTQQFITFSVSVTTSPLPLTTTVNKEQLITSFIISNPSTGISVFIGNQGVSTTTGLEVIAGTTPVFEILQEGRQLYELQEPALDIVSGQQCRRVEAFGIPFIVWDMTQWFVVAAAATTISVALFPAPYL